MLGSSRRTSGRGRVREEELGGGGTARTRGGGGRKVGFAGVLAALVILGGLDPAREEEEGVRMLLEVLISAELEQRRGSASSSGCGGGLTGVLAIWGFWHGGREEKERLSSCATTRSEGRAWRGRGGSGAGCPQRQ
jgi:hypothetical protein